MRLRNILLTGQGIENVQLHIDGNTALITWHSTWQVPHHVYVNERKVAVTWEHSLRIALNGMVDEVTVLVFAEAKDEPLTNGD